MSGLRPPSTNPLLQLHMQHQTLKAQYGKLGEARELLDHVRRGLDGLLNLGDMVTPDDVIKESGKLVGHGFGAAQMAELLASMPTTGGAPLQGWLKVHDADVTRREAQMDQVVSVYQHNLAVKGLQVLAADHLGAPVPGQATQQPIQSGGMALQSPNPQELESAA